MTLGDCFAEHIILDPLMIKAAGVFDDEEEEQGFDWRGLLGALAAGGALAGLGYAGYRALQPAKDTAGNPLFRPDGAPARNWDAHVAPIFGGVTPVTRQHLDAAKAAANALAASGVDPITGQPAPRGILGDTLSGTQRMVADNTLGASIGASAAAAGPSIFNVARRLANRGIDPSLQRSMEGVGSQLERGGDLTSTDIRAASAAGKSATGGKGGGKSPETAATPNRGWLRRLLPVSPTQGAEFTDRAAARVQELRALSDAERQDLGQRIRQAAGRGYADPRGPRTWRSWLGPKQRPNPTDAVGRLERELRRRSTGQRVAGVGRTGARAAVGGLLGAGVQALTAPGVAPEATPEQVEALLRRSSRQ